MDARFYNADDINIELLANNMEHIYRAQGYQAQHFGDNNQVMVQLKKGSDFEALIGLQAALSVIIQRSGGGVLAMIGQQKWMDKAAVGAIGIIAAPVLWPLMITAAGPRRVSGGLWSDGSELWEKAGGGPRAEWQHA